MADQEETNTETVLIGNLKGSNVVQTSYPLLTVIKQAKYTINEYKILSTYLSRINSQRPDSTVVTFSLKEFQNLAGLPNLKPSDMEQYIAGLNKEIKVPSETAALLDRNFTVRKDGFGYISLFGARFVGRNSNGKWIVELKCSEDAKKLFFFDFETTQYVACLLENLIDLVHIHSMNLYFHLLQESYRGTFIVPLDVLRDDWFGQADKESYKTFKYFKRDVLDIAVREVNAKTDITCSYETVKRGRAVASIRFTVKRKKKQKELNANAGGDDYDQLSIDFVDSQTPTASMIATISGGTFTKEEIQLIEEALYKKIPNKDEHGKRQDLFRDSYYQLQEAEKKNKQKGKKVNNRCSYLIRTIENARDSVWSPEGEGNFSPAFEQFYGEYPRQVQKASAYDAYKKVLHDNKDLTPEDLIQAARLYRTECENTHTEKKYIMYPANFLIQSKKYPNGKFAEYLEQAEVEAAAEAQRKAEEEAREADPEHQAEEERIRKEIRQKILKAEPEPSGSNKEKALEELMDYWREIRAADIEWPEEKDKEVHAGIEACLQTHSTKQVKTVLDDAAKYRGNTPDFTLVGKI